MNRRESLKFLGLGAVSATMLLDACKPNGEKLAEDDTSKNNDDASRQPNEIERDKKLNDEKYFTEHEMATIAVLADIIIPKDARSGSASDAKVPEFIEFIVKDKPYHKIPMRGGMRWLDLQCLNRYDKTFVNATSAQQLEMVNEIAYPKKAKPEMQQGVTFFTRMRNLTATGFFSSKMGIEDVGYVGNVPNQWTGVPPDIIKHYGLEDVAKTFV